MVTDCISFPRENCNGGWDIPLVDHKIQIRKGPKHGIGIQQFSQDGAFQGDNGNALSFESPLQRQQLRRENQIAPGGVVTVFAEAFCDMLRQEIRAEPVEGTVQKYRQAVVLRGLGQSIPIRYCFAQGSDAIGFRGARTGALQKQLRVRGWCSEFRHGDASPLGSARVPAGNNRYTQYSL